MEDSNTKEYARRYNKGKLRYDLLPANAVKELVKVYTHGANKYSDFDENGNMTYDAGFNWRKGQKWLEVLASAKRHIEAFELGEDFDSDPAMQGETKHLAHAVWNLMSILEFYTIHPELDNRIRWFNKPFKKVWLDLDGVIVSFEEYFLKYFNLPSHHAIDWNDYRFKNNLFKIDSCDEFWSGCPPLINPKDIMYPITGYCTARNCDNEIIREWIRRNNFPDAEIINVGHDGKKSDALKGKCDIMIDDSIKNFVDLNSNGILCYLMTRPHNEKYDVGHLRVNSMKEFFEKIIKQ